MRLRNSRSSKHAVEEPREAVFPRGFVKQLAAGSNSDAENLAILGVPAILKNAAARPWVSRGFQKNLRGNCPVRMTKATGTIARTLIRQLFGEFRLDPLCIYGKLVMHLQQVGYARNNLCSYDFDAHFSPLLACAHGRATFFPKFPPVGIHEIFSRTFLGEK